MKKSEFEKHLQTEARNKKSKRPSKECPEVDRNTQATVLYTRDWHDMMRRDFLHLSEGVTYDPDS